MADPGEAAKEYSYECLPGVGFHCNLLIWLIAAVLKCHEVKESGQ